MESIPTSYALIRDGLTWRIKSGEVVKIGMDPWIGCGKAHRLPKELRKYLISIGISHLSQIADNERSTFLQKAWKSGRTSDPSTMAATLERIHRGIHSIPYQDTRRGG